MFASWILVAGVAVVLLTAAVVAAFALGTGRARRSGDPSPVVRVTSIVAAVWAGLSVIGAVIALLLGLLSPSVAITMPVQEFWPEMPAGVEWDGGDAARVGGGFTSVSLLVDGLSAGVRVMWSISQAIGWLVPGAIAGLLALACFQLLAGRAFAPVVARMAMVTGVVVALGGVTAEVLGGIAGSMASHEVFASAGGSWQDIPGIDDPFRAWLPQPTLLIEFPFWPIAAGLGFAAVAAIFRYGSRLQKDAEWLV
ncbi:hypothetical protein AB3M83_02645 [Microbacterium sp. 179-B 1A2 NHS]|uniref:hypothetical protein n=1 Tax=Microbacterium sp. 179-B 1A2 NHS TaxID=3142383 RepID=UPI0039A02B8F